MGGRAKTVERWGDDALARLAALCEAALPGEGLDRRALAICCGGPEDVVIGTASGQAAAALAPGWDASAWHLQLLVVAPPAQGRGTGRQLLAEAREAARRLGATRLELGGGAKGARYLWPGVDVAHLRMLALADSAGARWTGAALNQACAADLQARPPAGVELRRVVARNDVEEVLAFTRAGFPMWSAELERGIDAGTAFVAVGPTGVLGMACHSVNRPGWFGPTAVDPTARGQGVGAALLAECCRDLAAAGHESVEIAWVGPIAFYAKVAGAAVSRVFRTGWLPTS